MNLDLKEYYNVTRTVVSKYGALGFFKMMWTDVLYDYRYGVDTYSPVAKKDLFKSKKRLELQNRYVPSTFSIIDYGINEARKIIGNDFSDVVFVDYGSGKAKVPIAATRYGFKKSIGIEYSQELHDIAVNNIKKLRLLEQVQLIHGDATKYIPSPDDRVLYFFNPFMGELLDTCLKNIKSVQANGERIIIVFNPTEDLIFSKYFVKKSHGVIKTGGVKYAVYSG